MRHPFSPARRCLPLILAIAMSLQASPGTAEETLENSGRRTPWTTSRVFGSPAAPLPYISERVFPSLKFTNCLDIRSIPGTQRLLVVEQGGRIFSFPNQPDVTTADLVADLAADIPGVKQVYSLAFHPKFQQNRYCYVCCIRKAGLEDGTFVARFRMSDTDPPTIDVASQTMIITWLSGGHNGCCLKFGPDGCLYISTGDGTGPNPPDIKQTGQDISDLLSSILRIDVDQVDDGLNYRIPADNPFVNQQNARGEVWAYGLRNPWRMSFDRQTGDLWVGDVGWELWEMLNRVERGGNYGWAVTEGSASTNPEWPRGPTPILPPTIAHPHSESSSITDGLTYYGRQLPELQGVHIYADYDTGRFWGFEFADGTVHNHRSLADTTHRVVGFGEDDQGELLFLDHIGGTIHRLIPNPQQDRSAEFPRLLSGTGLFESLTPLQPADGVIPYSINAEPWADHAVAERLVAVPDNGTITPTAAAWTLPNNSVLVRTLSLDMVEGNPASRRRVETQLLHFDGRRWNPYTYQWNDEQTEASLVSDSGLDQVFSITDQNAPEGIRRQTWRFAGRAECQRCHNNWSGPPLGFQTAQLNCAHPAGSGQLSQLDAWALNGLLATPVRPDQRPRLTSPHDTTAKLDARARSWLHVNCAHCHRRHAGGSVLSHMHFDLPLDQTNMILARPSQGTFGIPAASVITPGDPFRSVLFYRVSKLGGGRMPRLGSQEVDHAGVGLMHDWLSQLAADSETDAAAATFQHQQLTADLQLLAAEPSATERSSAINRMLSSTVGALRLLRAVDQGILTEATRATVITTATVHGNPVVRDLYERFLPADQRTKRLGTVVRPEQILSLNGDPTRGRRMLLESESISCRNCHRVGQHGKAVGPDLTDVGKRLNPAELLESILEPSRKIDPKYTTWLVETMDGLVATGLLVEKTDEKVVLRDAQNQLRSINKADIEQLVPQERSLMPELLFRDMTAQQVADLVAYLSSLTGAE